MVTVQQIVDLLVREGHAREIILPTALAGREVTGARADREAGPGDFGWLSRNVAEREQRARDFQGALLLAPLPCQWTARAGGAILECENPKLAFIRAAGAFFNDSEGGDWPEARAIVSADAVVGADVRLGAGAVIGKGCVLEQGAVIGPNTCLSHTTVGSGSRIGCNCTIGQPGFGFERSASGAYQRFPHFGRVIIEENVEIGNNTCIDRGALGDTIIGRGSKIDNLVHIAHNVVLGADVVVIANAMVAGSVAIGAGAWIAPSASILNQKHIGAGAIVGLGAVVVRSVDEGATVVGNPARPLPARP